MNVDEILALVAARGLKLSAAEGRLRLHGDLTSVDEPLKRAIADSRTELLALLQQTGHGVLPGIAANAAVAMTPTQRAIFDDYALAGSAYHMPILLAFGPGVSVAALSESLVELVARHPALSSRYFVSDEGEYLQQPVPELALCVGFEHVPPDSVESAIQRLVEAPFALAQGEAFRATILCLGRDTYRMCGVAHHIAADGWSTELLRRDLGAIYAARLARRRSPDTPPAGFARYAAALSAARAERRRETEAFWRARMADRPAAKRLNLLPAEAAGSVVFDGHVPAQLAEAAQTLARAADATIYPLFLAASALVLARLGGQRELLVACPTANRTLPGADEVVGLFLDNFPVRVRTVGRTPVREHLRRLSAELRLCEAHAHLSLAEILALDAAGPLGEALPQLSVNLLNYPRHPLPLGAVAPVPLDTPPLAAKYPLTLYIEAGDDGALAIRYHAQAQRFSVEGLTLIHARLIAVLRAMTQSPDAALGTIAGAEPTLGAATSLPPFASVSDRFRAIARTVPSAPALRCDGETWSYALLSRRVDAVAAGIAALGVRRGDRVLIIARRDPWLPVAILACLGRGLPYLVVEPGAAVERYREALASIDCAAVLRVGCLDAEPVGPFTAGHDVAGLAARHDGEGAPFESLHPGEIACLTMTSGSSGAPRAVAGRHAGLVLQLDETISRYRIGPKDRFALLGGLMSDPLQRDMFTPLCTGSCLCVPAQAVLHPDHLAAWVRNSGVTVLNLTPALGAWLAGGKPDPNPEVRWTFICGDVLTWPDVRRLRAALPGSGIVNLYGLTESQRALTHHLCLHPGEPVPPARVGPVPVAAEGPGVHLRLIDTDGRHVLPFETAEIHLFGSEIAAGFADQPGETALRFHPDTGGRRALATGDHGVLLPDGKILHAGRGADEANIRGVRFALVEVERCMEAIEGVTSARAFLDEAAGGEPKLCACWVGTDAIDEALIARRLRERLPSAMVPSRLRRVPRMPVNNAGKVALGQLRAAPAEARAAISLCEEPGRTVARIWSDVLRTNVAPEDEFFALGGHSLLAVELSDKLGNAFGRAYPIDRLFENATLADCIAFFAEADAADASERDDGRAAPTPCVDPSAPFPLTDVQQAYLLGRGADFDSGGTATATYLEYAVSAADCARVPAILNRLIERHAMLRTVALPDGMQRTLEPRSFEVRRQDLRMLSRGQIEAALACWRQEMETGVFNPAEWPLFDVRVSLLPDGAAILHVSLDLLMIDYWSSRILMDEFARLLEDGRADLPQPGFDFASYCWHVQARRDGAAWRRAQDYWLARIPDMPGGPLLPMRRPAPQGAPSFVRRAFRLDTAQWRRLGERAAAIGTTRSTVLLTAYADTLALWAESPQFVINLTLFDRPRIHPDIDRTVGDFTSLILVEMEAAEGRFTDRLLRVKRRLLSCLEHRAFGAVEIFREMRRGGNRRAAIAPVVFTDTLEVGEAPQLARVKEIYRNARSSQVWIDHTAGHDGDGVLLAWNTVDSLFPSGMTEAMFTAYRAFVEQLCAETADWSRIGGASLPASETARRQRYNDVPQPPSAALIHDGFLFWSEKDPDRTALIGSAGRWTYGELRREATSLAAALAGTAVVRGEFVAILLPKGWRQIVAVLATALTGAAWLPVNPDLPPQRVRALLANARVRVVVADEAARARHGLIDFLVVDAAARPGADAMAGFADMVADDPAYAIYTSGSTGTPKAVTITHRAAVTTLRAIEALFELGPDDRVFGLSSLSFDLSVFDIFGTFAAGAALVLPDEGELGRPAEWASLVRGHGVTVWNSVPALLQVLLDGLEPDARLDTLRLVMLSGDFIPLNLPDAARRHAPAARCVSLGGATEAAIWSIWFPIDQVEPDWRSIPYGMPLPGQTIEVLGPAHRPRAEEAVGEIFIGGAGLAREYLGDPARTRSSFVVDSRTGVRRYATGDLGIFAAAGYVEIAGRRDNQVKLRGQRVELGEIAAALANLPDVQQALAVVRNDIARDKAVLGVVVDPGASQGEDAPQWSLESQERTAPWRELLSATLPAHMVPSAFLRLRALPLTRNGKVDRRALTERPVTSLVQATPADRPLAEIEQSVAAIWMDVLGLCEPVRPDDDFLQLGGNSLLAMRCLNRINREHDLSLSLGDVYAAPRLSTLAAIVERGLLVREVQSVRPDAAAEMERGEI